MFYQMNKSLLRGTIPDIDDTYTVPMMSALTIIA